MDMKKLIACAFCLAACAGSARAAAVIWFTEIGGNVVATLSGSLNLSGLTAQTGFVSGNATLWPEFAWVSTGTVGAPQRGYLDQVTGPSQISPASFTDPNSVSGDSVALIGDDLWVPDSYVSGNPLAATMTFLGESFASLGVAPGNYVYSLRTQDTLTIRFANSVPLPGTLLLALGALSAAGMVARRRRT